MTPDPLPGVPEVEITAGGGFATAVSRMTGVNAIAIVAGLVSGPILSRTLGPAGRGELAAIVVVVGIAPSLLDFGLAQWVARERARGRPREEILGVALPVAFVCSLLGVAVAIPLSHALGAGRGVVVTFVQLGLFLTPIGVVLFTLSGLAVGESRWDLVAEARLVATVGPVLAIVVLSVVGGLTVASAAAATLSALLLGLLVPLRLLHGVRPAKFGLRRARLAISFGAKGWLTTISGTANVRLDQALMAGLVSSRELGLYAVAVSVASLTSGLITAVSNALYPRVARGDGDLSARSCRVVILIVAVAAAFLAAVAWWAVPFVFGSDFDGAVAMVLILLLASLPLSAAVVLATALNAAGNPAATMRAELVGNLVTIPSLLVFLPGYGGIAAATISLGAYGARFAMLLRSASDTFARPAATFLIPTGSDVRWLADQARRSSKQTSPR